MAKKAARKRKKPAPKKPVKWSVWFHANNPTPCEHGRNVLNFILDLEKKKKSTRQIWELARRFNGGEYVQEFINWYENEVSTGEPEEFERIKRLIQNDSWSFSTDFRRAAKAEMARLAPPVYDTNHTTMPCPLVYADGSTQLKPSKAKRT